MTPVFYSYEALASKNEIFGLILYWLNPVSVLLISAREAVTQNNITLQLNVLAVMSLFLVLFYIGYNFYKKQIKKIAEYF
jgi:ABC-type polysaccharide/polyol phosphate export permease